MIILALQKIMKLKLLKIYTIYIFKSFEFKYRQNNYFFIYIFFYNLNKISLFNNNNNLPLNMFYYFHLNINYLNLVKSKLKFFKNNYLNSFIFYNLINNSFYNNKLLINFNISNYDSKYLFIYYYYFIKNVKLGVNKYFVNYYQNNLFFIRFFILKYIKSFIKNNLFISLQKNNITILEKTFFYNTLVKKTKYLKFLKEINFKIKAFLNLLLISLYSKDVILLKNGIKNILERLHFKKHRKFLHNLKLLLKSLSSIFFYKFRCLGLYIKIKGKIGLGGSSKKKKFVFKLGSFSFTKKSQKVNYVKDCIRTYSGVLGFELYLTYK